MKRALQIPRTTCRHLSTRGPRGPRGILDKSRTPGRLTPRAARAGQQHLPSPDTRRQSSSQDKPEPQQRRGQESGQQPEPKPGQQPASSVELVSHALAENESSDLVAPVRMPDDPEGVLHKDHPAMAILNNSAVVIQRQLEMMNVFLGFEQANKYIIMNGRGETIGYLAEQDHGMGRALIRQALRTHRSFTAHIFDANEREVLRIHRPFSWISSRIRIYDPCSPDQDATNYSQSSALQGTSSSSVINPESAMANISALPLEDMRIIGEAQQQWAPLRRKYNLFSYRPLASPSPESATIPKLTSGDLPNTESKALAVTNSRSDQAIDAGMSQFAYISEPFLSWDFTLKSSADETLGSVNRNFSGFAREIFTDTGVYALRMDSAVLEHQENQQSVAMTLDQRATMLATAVSIDFDYFSRHSGAMGGGGFMPLWFPGMGGGAAEGGAVGGAVGGAAGEAGAAEGALGGVARGAGSIGAGEAGAVGAGTIAGAEAMRRGQEGAGGAAADEASPTAHEPWQDQAVDGQQQQQPPPSSEQTPWGEQSPWGQEQEQDPWGQQPDNDPWSQGNSTGGGGSGGGEGGGFDWGDWF